MLPSLQWGIIVYTLGVDRITYVTRIQEAENLIGGMSRAEKAAVLRWIAIDLGEDYTGIESSPGVCEGEARIVRTRIPVWLLEQARRLGTTEADLLRSYPDLRAEDLVSAWGYVSSHREEIDRAIAENEEA